MLDDTSWLINWTVSYVRRSEILGAIYVLKVSEDDFFIHEIPKSVYSVDNSVENGHLATMPCPCGVLVEVIAD